MLTGIAILAIAFGLPGLIALALRRLGVRTVVIIWVYGSLVIGFALLLAVITTSLAD